MEHKFYLQKYILQLPFLVTGVTHTDFLSEPAAIESNIRNLTADEMCTATLSPQPQGSIPPVHTGPRIYHVLPYIYLW